MEQLNRYYRCSKISERKMRQVVRFFAHDLTASKTAELVGLTRRSVTVLFVKIRQRIAEECERASPFAGIVEVDESYFGARRVRRLRAVAVQAERPSSSVSSNVTTDLPASTSRTTWSLSSLVN